MDSILNEEWLQDYYLELDAQKRMDILRSNLGDCQTGTEKLINTLWTARYGKKKPKNDLPVFKDVYQMTLRIFQVTTNFTGDA